VNPRSAVSLKQWLTRARREQAVREVTKPRRRNVAGEANPRQVDLRVRNVLKGAKSPGEEASACLGRTDAQVDNRKLWRKMRLRKVVIRMFEQHPVRVGRENHRAEGRPTAKWDPENQ